MPDKQRLHRRIKHAGKHPDECKKAHEWENYQ